MAYKKQKWVEYDETLSEEENVKLGAVVTSDRMNHLEEGVESNETSLKKHTDDNNNPHKVTKAQVGLSNVTDDKQATKLEHDKHVKDEKNPHKVTAAQVGAMTPEDSQKLIMDFLNGKSVEVTIKSDFAGKEAGSEVECPHVFRMLASTTMPDPSGFISEPPQVTYNAISKLDGVTSNPSTKDNGKSAYGLTSYNILETVKRAYPFLFEGLSDSAQESKLNAIFKQLKLQSHAKGSGPEGNSVNLRRWNKTGSGGWVLVKNSASATITDLASGLAWTDSYIPNMYSERGIIPFLIDAPPSDGIIPSSVSLDYTNVEITLKLSMKDFFATATDYQNLENRVRVLENVLTELGGTV